MNLLKFQDLIGKKWSDGGRGPDTYDCMGLWLVWAERRGIDLKDPDVRCADVCPELGLGPLIGPGWAEIASSEASEDDVMVLPRDGAEAHVAIVMAEGQVLHCSVMHGVSAAPLRWARRYAVRAFRYGSCA